MKKIFEFKLWLLLNGNLDDEVVYLSGNSKMNRAMILFGGCYQNPELDVGPLYNKV